jgi:hypothetical protein
MRSSFWSFSCDWLLQADQLVTLCPGGWPRCMQDW